MIRYQKYQLFPTEVIKVDFSSVLDNTDIQSMMYDIDYMCENKIEIQTSTNTPLYQSKPVLFLENVPPVWKKLKDSFYQACQIYIDQVDNFCNNQKYIEFTGSRAWFYKGWKSLDQTQLNPWHAHQPAFLSGVFYLKIPNKTELEGGTEFSDPRLAEARNKYQYVAPLELSWVIFPGWLYHKSNQCDSEDPRYVIAADIYARVK